MSHRDIFYFRKVTDAGREDNSTRTVEKFCLILWIFLFCERILDHRAIRKPGRADQHRKSRSYCRAKRPDRTKSLLGSQQSHKVRIHNVVPAQTGVPDSTLPPCGVRTFPPCRRLKCISDRKKNGVTKGRERALKYAVGVRARGERRYAIFERTVKNIPVEYFLAMEANRRFPILWLSFSF